MHCWLAQDRFSILCFIENRVVISKSVIETKRVELGSGDEYRGFIFHFKFMLTFGIFPPLFVISSSVLLLYLYLAWCFLDLSWSSK